MELYQQGRSQYQPKITSETTRKIWLDVITWKYDFIQQYKKRCFQFAEAVIIRIALREQEVNGKNLINFPEDNISIESFYDRLRPCYDSIMQFGDRVLVAQMNWNGMLEGAVYGFVEDPEEGWSPIECRLELLKISDETYTDAGHAIEWCIKNAH